MPCKHSIRYILERYMLDPYKRLLICINDEYHTIFNEHCNSAANIL